MGDLSSQSGDHGVPVNPAVGAAHRGGARPGHAALRRQRDRRPRQHRDRPDSDREASPTPTGSVTFNLGSNSTPVGARRRRAHRQWHASRCTSAAAASAPTTTARPRARSTIRSRAAASSNVGGGWTGDAPVRRRELRLRRHQVRRAGARGGQHQPHAPAPRVLGARRRPGARRRCSRRTAPRWACAATRTPSSRAPRWARRFKNNTVEGEVLLSHRPAGRVSGSIGGWFLNREFSADGAEALAPPVDQRGAAAFLYEEVTWPHFTLQFGGRVDRTTFEPRARAARAQLHGGLDVGRRAASVRGRPTTTSSWPLSVARAARNPALEELYFFGPHTGNLAVRDRQPRRWRPERGLGFDVSLRGRVRRGCRAS